jgi:hypothetical protein
MGLRSVHTLDVPGEEGEWIKVKFPSRLRVRALKAEASTAARLPGEEKLEAHGWNLISNVLHDSIIAWSYCEDGEPVPVTPENVDDLDNKTASWLFDELMGNDKDDAKKDD